VNDVTITSGLSVEYLLGSELLCPRRARALTRQALGNWGLAEHSDLAELVVSELVTNAVCHGLGPISLRLSYGGNRLRTEVHDRGAGRPVRKHATIEDESGRGLELLDSLIAIYGGDLGVLEDTDALGKTVCVEVFLPKDLPGA